MPAAGIIYKNASYTMDEIQSILDQSKLEESIVKKTLMGFEITEKKGIVSKKHVLGALLS